MRCALFALACAAALGWGGESRLSGAASSAGPAQLTRVPPPLPPMPLDFRRLLELPVAERDQVLTNRSPQDRALLQAKIREYEALAPEVREVRLQSLQVQLYLRTLTKHAPSNRVQRLALVPEADRKRVEERLELWDKLPPDLQQDLLTNATLLRLVFQPEGNWAIQGLTAGAAASQRHTELEQSVARWNQLPPERRLEIQQQFEKIFGLDPQRQTQLVNSFSEEERLKMERTLKLFSNLSFEQRQRCITGFQKLASLPPEQRDEFLRNAEHWQQMSPQERESWRRLVARLNAPGPPLPPGLIRRQLPPLPPPFPTQSSRVTAIATNTPITP